MISFGYIFWLWAGVQARPWFTVLGLFFEGVCLAYLSKADLKCFGRMGIISQKCPAKREPVLKAMALTKNSGSQRLEKDVVPTGEAQKVGVRVFT